MAESTFRYRGAAVVVKSTRCGGFDIRRVLEGYILVTPADNGVGCTRWAGMCWW